MYNKTNEQTPRLKRSAIQEKLLNASWEDLADRSCPLPEGVRPEDVLKHFGQMMLIQYNDRYGVGTINPRNS